MNASKEEVVKVVNELKELGVQDFDEKPTTPDSQEICYLLGKMSSSMGIDQSKIVNRFIDDRYLTTAQVVLIASSFNYESDRLVFIKTAYLRTIDRESYLDSINKSGLRSSWYYANYATSEDKALDVFVKLAKDTPLPPLKPKPIKPVTTGLPLVYTEKQYVLAVLCSGIVCSILSALLTAAAIG